MSNVTEQSTADDKIDSKDEEVVNVVIDVNNLTDNQKTLLLITGVSFVIQIFFLFNMHIFTDLFKGFIVSQYDLAGAYIVDFFQSLLLYLVIIFFFVDIYFVYKILLNTKDSMNALSEIFSLITLLFIVLIAMFFIAISSIPVFPLSPFYPTMVELVLFFIVVFFSLFILFIPFGVKKYFLKED